VPVFREDRAVRERVTLTDQLLTGVDAAMVVTNHSGIDYARVLELAPIVVDTRNATLAGRRGPGRPNPGGWIVKGYRSAATDTRAPESS